MISTMKNLFIAAIGLSLLLIPVLFSAQTDHPASAGSSVYAELTKAPKKEANRRNPFENDHDAPVAGAKLFAQHCAECHGNTADGGKKGPSLRVNDVQQAAPGTIYWVLTNGVVRKGMPVWSKLPDAQRWQLVTYIKSLGSTSKADEHM